MIRPSSSLASTMFVLIGGCTGNSAVGNDREAQLDPAPRPAEVMAASAALQGIAPELVIPQIMTDADLGNVPDMTNRCMFRMTKVGEPVIIYGPQAVVKLNGRLVPLPASSEGGYAAAGVTVTVMSVDEDAEVEGPVETDFVLRLPGIRHERGYRGFAECRDPR